MNSPTVNTSAAATAAVASTVDSKLNNGHVMMETVFRFKKDKLGNQRSSIKMMIPVPTPELVSGVLISGDEKQWGLIQESLYDVVRGTLAGYVSDESFDPEKFDIKSLFWDKIANMSKEDRRSSSIAEEVWTAFAADYVSVMPGLTGKTTDQAKNATEVFVRKLVPVKTNKALIARLKDQLALYSSQPSAENYTEILDLLLKRCDTYLAADDMAAIIGNL